MTDRPPDRQTDRHLENTECSVVVFCDTCDTSVSIVIPNVTIPVSPCSSNNSTVGNDCTLQSGNKVTVKQILQIVVSAQH